MFEIIAAILFGSVLAGFGIFLFIYSYTDLRDLNKEMKEWDDRSAKKSK